MVGGERQVGEAARGRHAGCGAAVRAAARLLLRRVPVPDVLVTVYVGEGALAVGLVVLPVALVPLSVDVLQHAVPLLDVVLPLAVILVAVGEGVQTAPVHLTIEPLSFVDAAVRVQVLAVAVHPTVAPVALELLRHAAVGRGVSDRALAMPPVILPIALVPARGCEVGAWEERGPRWAEIAVGCRRSRLPPPQGR